MRFVIEIMLILKAIKSHLKGNLINRILYSPHFNDVGDVPDEVSILHVCQIESITVVQA